MEDKKVIITEDSVNSQPKIDVRIDEQKQRVIDKVGYPSSSIYETYQKYANINIERDHVLTLRRGK